MLLCFLLVEETRWRPSSWVRHSSISTCYSGIDLLFLWISMSLTQKLIPFLLKAHERTCTIFFSYKTCVKRTDQGKWSDYEKFKRLPFCDAVLRSLQKKDSSLGQSNSYSGMLVRCYIVFIVTLIIILCGWVFALKANEGTTSCNWHHQFSSIINDHWAPFGHDVLRFLLIVHYTLLKMYKLSACPHQCLWTILSHHNQIFSHLGEETDDRHPEWHRYHLFLHSQHWWL